MKQKEKPRANQGTKPKQLALANAMGTVPWLGHHGAALARCAVLYQRARQTTSSLTGAPTVSKVVVTPYLARWVEAMEPWSTRSRPYLLTMRAGHQERFPADDVIIENAPNSPSLKPLLMR